MRQSWETMTSVSAGHIILTPTQPVGSGRPQRESNPGPPHQESRVLPTELPPPPPPPPPQKKKKKTKTKKNKNKKKQQCKLRKVLYLFTFFILILSSRDHWLIERGQCYSMCAESEGESGITVTPTATVRAPSG